MVSVSCAGRVACVRSVSGALLGVRGLWAMRGGACGGGYVVRRGLVGSARCWKGPTLVSAKHSGMGGGVVLGSARVVERLAWQALWV